MNKPTQPISILLADDHSIVRIGLKALLDYQPDMSVVGEAKNGAEAIRLARQLQPSVVLMDLMMPKASGAEATRQILQECPDIKIIVLTSFGTSADLIRAISYGAVGAQLKETEPEKLLSAIRAVAGGKRAISPELKELLHEPPPPNLDRLDLQILESAVRGLSNNDIAAQYNLSLISTKRHLARIFEKLGAANRTEAVAIALRKHLLKI